MEIASTGVYVNRAFGGNCYHCSIDVDIDAGTEPGEAAGEDGHLSVEPASMEPYLEDVHRR